MDQDTGHVGRRVREIRSWRGLTLKQCAQLAGISEGHLSRIERGERPVERRATLEALATALAVAPSDLRDEPWTGGDASAPSPGHSTLVEVEAALDQYELGDDPGLPVREWPEIAADLHRLTDLMHVTADYAAQGEMVPPLLGELHSAYVRTPRRRPDVLLGLVHTYSSACWVTKRLGGRGLPSTAARLAQQAAEELGRPEWRGYAAWLRGDAAGQLSRPQHLRRAVAMADQLTPHLDDEAVQQAYGMLHLSAALAAAAQDDRDTAGTHLDEASAIASRMDQPVGGFARLWFGEVNVGIWRTTIASEFGDSEHVPEIASGVQVDAIPSPSRRAEFHAEVGRAELASPRTRDQGLERLLRAERLAPQRIRNDVFVREAVSGQLRAARRKAGGRDLRGLAYRMGIAGLT